MRNEIERIVQMYLENLEPGRWTYEPGRVAFSMRYLPDFRRDDGVIIEVKGKARPEDLVKIGRINETLQAKKVDFNLPDTLQTDSEVLALTNQLKELLRKRGYNLRVEFYLDYSRFIVAPLVNSVTLVKAKKNRVITHVPLKTCSGETLINWLDFNGVECAPITYTNQSAIKELLDKSRRFVV